MPKSDSMRKFVYQGDPLSSPPPPELLEITDRYRGQRDALITVLEEMQHHYGYLPQRQLQYTARELDVPLSRIYGIATFYNFFRLNPPGRHLIRVCRGTACHVNHSVEMLALLKDKLGIAEDETTPDGLFTLQVVACVGACSLAPVLVADDRTYGRMTPDKAWETVEAMREAASNGKDGQ